MNVVAGPDRDRGKANDLTVLPHRAIDRKIVPRDFVTGRDVATRALENADVIRWMQD
jgi:hypothetical protein